MQPALLQIQLDVTARLMVELAAWGITVRSQRKMIVTNDIDEAQLVMTLTNGKTGAGCLVQMPTFESQTPNVPGPIGFIQIKITVMEAPEYNMQAASGTLRSAEEIAGRVSQLLHLWVLTNIGTFNGGSISKGEQQPGIVSYDVVLKHAYGHDILAKATQPVITSTGGTVTITGGAGETVYYTIDGESYPGPEMPNSFLYSGAFASTVGVVIRSVGYVSGSAGSDLAEHTVT